MYWAQLTAQTQQKIHKEIVCNYCEYNQYLDIKLLNIFYGFHAIKLGVNWNSLRIEIVSHLIDGIMSITTCLVMYFYEMKLWC